MPTHNAAALRRCSTARTTPIATSLCSTPARLSSCAGQANDLPEGVEAAAASIDSGMARAALTKLVEVSKPGGVGRR